MTRDGWDIEIGRWNSIKNDWKSGAFTKQNLIFKAITSFPIIFLEWIGRLDRLYYASEDRFGAHNPFAPHNLYRQLWHFNGGAIANVFPSLLGIGVTTAFMISTVIVVIELKTDVDDDWQTCLKSVLDVIAWLSGALFINWIL